MDKKDTVPIYNGILLSHKNPGNNAICSNKDATRDDHTEKRVDQKDKDKYHTISLKCGI